ncbi:MAG: class I SAM-dependent methyltransferase [Xanthomonadaceae bacterium]|nr:class I SAM-dependent methyltransferase [Xanthomonadaceae bacterium]
MKKQTGVALGYVHGFTKVEQERLYEQARFLESKIFEKIDFVKQTHILEVGCGVGAQTEILLRRFPHIKITGVDASPKQIETAKKHLKKDIQNKRVQLLTGDAFKLPFKKNEFDGAFVCWLLEHVQRPIEILKEAKRTLKTGGVIYCNEVLNSTFFVHPYSPATMNYWFAFNDQQWNLKGDPFVGAKLANYLIAAKFLSVTTEVKTFHYDNRSTKQRAEFIDYWTNLLLSGAPGLLKAKKIDQKTVKEMKAELKRLKNDKDSVIFYSFVQARAESL